MDVSDEATDDACATASKRSSSPFRYVLLHKPRGVLTARRRDPSSLDTATVTEILAAAGLPSPERIWPVGRLDKDSEGLLLLTNDGKLTTRMIHPDFKCPKVYLAVARGYGRPTMRSRCSDSLCARWVADGVSLRTKRTAVPFIAKPLEAELVSYAEADRALGGSLRRCLDELVDVPEEADAVAAAAAAEAAELDFVRVVLAEGKWHEVRLVLRSGGFATLRLVRLAHGPIRSPELLAAAPGTWREAHEEERERLRRDAFGELRT